MVPFENYLAFKEFRLFQLVKQKKAKKAKELKVIKTFRLDPEVIDWLETEGESFEDRIVKLEQTVFRKRA